MVIVALFGASLTMITFAIGVVSWTAVARITRSEFLRIRELEYVTASRAVMVGDTEYDIDMAHAAGAHAIAVTYGVHSRARLLAKSPHLVVDSIESLPGALSDYAQ